MSESQQSGAALELKYEDGRTELPQSVADAVLVESSKEALDREEVKGYDLRDGLDWNKLFSCYRTTGFQATNVGRAIDIVNEMLRWRLSDEPVAEDEDEEYRDAEVRARTKAKIFLGFTSNMSSCGMRDFIRFLCQHKLVDCLVTTAGGIEEDFIKCLAPTYLGDFGLKGTELRKKGLNRIGNLLVPNNNYCLFEDWILPIFDSMLEEQKSQGMVWSPSKMIRRLGKEIDNENSIFYWCWKNDIPVYSPAITDGSLGDMIYFHSYKNPGLIVDIAQDIRSINNETVFAKKTGMIIIGGGLVKHHICNANLMRNGADWSVFINTAQEFDGSDSGARPDEAVSWGKIRLGAKSVKVYAEATIVWPIIVGMSFYPYWEEQQKKSKGQEGNEGQQQQQQQGVDEKEKEKGEAK